MAYEVDQQRSIAADVMTTRHGINYTHIMLFGNLVPDLPNSQTCCLWGFGITHTLPRHSPKKSAVFSNGLLGQYTTR
jgi:hypothetical protein